MDGCNNEAQVVTPSSSSSSPFHAVELGGVDVGEGDCRRTLAVKALESIGKHDGQKERCKKRRCDNDLSHSAFLPFHPSIHHV